MNKKIIIALTILFVASLACSALTGVTPMPLAPTSVVASDDEFSLSSSTTQPTPNLSSGGRNLANHTSKIESDITYCTVNGTDLKLDLYFPKSLNGPSSAVVYVHGGGWSEGDKREGAGLIVFPALLDVGVIVGSVNYRLAPQYQFPAMIEDVQCAISFLRDNASQYDIDPNKIGVWGGSAGGHLVSLLGVTDQSTGFDVGQYLDQSSRVQAVVDMFGPADLTISFSSTYIQLRDSVFGTYDLAKASPVTYISADDPPFLILQGDADTTVPLSQSPEFYDKLIAASITAQLVVVKDGNHGLTDPYEFPPRDDLTNLIVQFFEKELK